MHLPADLPTTTCMHSVHACVTVCNNRVFNSAGFYIRDARNSKVDYGFNHYIDDYDKEIKYVTTHVPSSNYTVNMQFQQFVGHRRYGQEVYIMST